MSIQEFSKAERRLARAKPKLKIALIAILIMATAQLVERHAYAQAPEDDQDLTLDADDGALEGQNGNADGDATVEQQADEELNLEATEPAPAAPVSLAGASGQDDPNLDFERRLFRISKNLKPVSSNRWSEMVGSKKEDVYVVQSGDTLWDISQTLFGDGFFWSKLWAENSSLENPHRIGKGQGIRFVGGDEDTAPVVNVVSAKTAETIRINAFRDETGEAPMYRDQALRDLTPEELSDKGAIEVDELIPQPELPPKTSRRKILTRLPPSFHRRAVPLENEYDITGLDVGTSRSLTVPAAVAPSSYILDHEPRSVGKIDEIEATERVAAVGQNVFVRLKRSATIGERFTAILVKGKITDPVRGAIGPVIEVGGVIEIISAVKESQHVYRAAVIGALNPVAKDSLVIEETLPKASYVRRGTRLDIDARIIGGEYDENRKVIGESSVVYLDKGSNVGLKPGDILSVQARRGERRDETKFPDWRRPIGLLKIVKAERTVSTAIVVEAQEEIIPGDHTGGALPEYARPINGNEDPLSKQ